MMCQVLKENQKRQKELAQEYCDNQFNADLGSPDREKDARRAHKAKVRNARKQRHKKNRSKGHVQNWYRKDRDEDGPNYREPRKYKGKNSWGNYLGCYSTKGTEILQDEELATDKCQSLCSLSMGSVESDLAKIHHGEEISYDEWIKKVSKDAVSKSKMDRTEQWMDTYMKMCHCHRPKQTLDWHQERNLPFWKKAPRGWQVMWPDKKYFIPVIRNPRAVKWGSAKDQEMYDHQIGSPPIEFEEEDLLGREPIHKETKEEIKEKQTKIMNHYEKIMKQEQEERVKLWKKNAQILRVVDRKIIQLQWYRRQLLHSSKTPLRKLYVHEAETIVSGNSLELDEAKSMDSEEDAA